MTKQPDLKVTEDLTSMLPKGTKPLYKLEKQQQPVPTFKPRGVTYLELKLEDALYLPKLKDLPIHKFSEDAGWGLQKPYSRLVSYQRLWEYYMKQDTLREELSRDLKLADATGYSKLLSISASYHGVGFEKQLGNFNLNH